MGCGMDHIVENRTGRDTVSGGSSQNSIWLYGLVECGVGICRRNLHGLATVFQRAPSESVPLGVRDALPR
jgi:hypothetical protein